MSEVQTGIKKALADGVPPDEVLRYLSSRPDVGPGIQAAMADGVPSTEILRYLASPQRAQGAAMPTLARGAATFMQGPTFGFFDEIAGGVSAPFRALKEGIPLGEAYRQGRDVVRGATGSFMEENPVLGTALQVGGGLLTPGGALKAGANLLRGGRGATAAAPVAQITSRPRQVAQATGAGAGYGFLGGVGGSEADTVSGVLSDAASGAAFGAGTSGGAQVLGAAASPILRQATTRLSPKAAGTYAQQKVAEAMMRDAPEGFEQNVLNRAQARLRTLGPEARVVDAAGRNTQRLLDLTATIPGRTTQATEQAIRQRQAGRASRLEGSADTILGTRNADVGELIENLSVQRSAAARPFYQQVDPVPVVVDDGLATLLRKSRAQHSGAQGKYLAETGQEIDLSALRPGDSIPFKVLDVLKQEIDDVAGGAKASNRSGDARIYGNLAEDLVAKLDDVSPKNEAGQSIYSIARNLWAGPTKLQEAADLGSKSMSENVSELNTAMRKMTDSEIEAFRIGALQALRDQVGTRSGQTKVLNMWVEKKTQRQLRAIFGNDFREFAAAVAREERLRPMEAAGRGSKTAAMQAGMADIDVSPVSGAVNVASAAGANIPGGALINAVAPMVGRVTTPEPVRNEIGRILLSRDQQELLNLSNTIRAINESRARQAQALGRVGGQAGVISAQ
jgi:hypothetical protein